MDRASRRFATLLPLVSALSACTGSSADRSHAAAASCIATRTAVGLDDATPVGTGRAVLDAIRGAHEATLTWHDGTTTRATITVADAPVSATFVDQSRNPDDDTEMAVSCDDYVELTTTTVFATDDGKLDEAWNDAAWRSPWGAVDAGSGASLYRPLDFAALHGTYAPNEVTLASNQRIVQPTFQSTIANGVLSGSLAYVVETRSGDSPDDSAGASWLTAATFGP